MSDHTKKGSKPTDAEKHDEEMPNISCTASATECTGLISTAPQNEEEYEAYKELFSMEIPQDDAP